MSTGIFDIETENQTDRLQRIGRRAFIVSAATAVSAAAFWGLRRSTIAAARPLGAEEGPKTVTIVEFAADGTQTGTVTVARVIKTDAAWRHQLSQTSYWVTRHADTERPYSGDLLDQHDHGIFRCICCDLALFNSETKFDSGTGWPSEAGISLSLGRIWHLLKKLGLRLKKSHSTLSSGTLKPTVSDAKNSWRASSRSHRSG